MFLCLFVHSVHGGGGGAGLPTGGKGVCPPGKVDPLPQEVQTPLRKADPPCRNVDLLQIHRYPVHRFQIAAASR